MDRTAAFEAERQRLFAIAYRMLGTASDAADVVQEAWLRWQRASDTEIDSPHIVLTNKLPSTFCSTFSMTSVRMMRMPLSTMALCKPWRRS